MPARIQSFISSSNKAGPPPRRTRTRAKNHRKKCERPASRTHHCCHAFTLASHACPHINRREPVRFREIAEAIAGVGSGHANLPAAADDLRHAIQENGVPRGSLVSGSGVHHAKPLHISDRDNALLIVDQLLLCHKDCRLKYNSSREGTRRNGARPSRLIGIRGS